MDKVNKDKQNKLCPADFAVKLYFTLADEEYKQEMCIHFGTPTEHSNNRPSVSSKTSDKDLSEEELSYTDSDSLSDTDDEGEWPPSSVDV